MAGDWIKFEKCTSDKPEVWAIASKLNIDPDAVVGKLLRIWVWFDEQSLSGNARSVTKMLLDRKVGVTGFCSAMIEAGWMLETDNEIRLPNFDRHNGETAKNRALTAKRVVKHRNRNADVTQEALQKKASSVTGSVTQALPEKRREEKSIPPIIPQGIEGGIQIPEKLNTDRFKKALLSWFDVIKENRPCKKVDYPAVQVVIETLALNHSERKSVAFVLAWASLGRYTHKWDVDWEEFLPKEETSPKRTQRLPSRLEQKAMEAAQNV